MTNRRGRLAGCALMAVSFIGAGCSGSGTKANDSADAPSVDTPDRDAAAFEPTVALRWNQVALAAVRHDTNPVPTVTARSLFIVHAAMYEAWAAYEPTAQGSVTGTQLDTTGSDADQAAAVSVAAYWAFEDQFPTFSRDTGAPAALLGESVGEPQKTPAAGTPQGIGRAAADAVTKARQNDGANEAGAYSEPVDNLYGAWQEGSDPGLTAWTPLKVPTGQVLDLDGRAVVEVDNPNSFSQQAFLTPHWGQVAPFALAAGAALRPTAPPRFGSNEPYVDALGAPSTSHEAFVNQFTEVLNLNATLTDEQKLMAEYWTDGPRSETAPGHWNTLAHGVSVRDAHSLDDDVKMYFALNAALFDASIAGWDAKRFYNSPRPVTVIQRLYETDEVLAWGGPNAGTRRVDGTAWLPYLPINVGTPAMPDYVADQSVFGAAGAAVLQYYTGSDVFFDGTTTLPWDRDGDDKADLLGQTIYTPGSGTFERLPDQIVKLAWSTFSAAADEAGRSRIYAGTHTQDADLRGRQMGRSAADAAWARTTVLWGQS